MPDRKTVMSWLEGLAQDDWREWHSDSEVQTTAQAALDLLKAQEPKVPIHIHEEYPEHDWEKDKNGKVDEFAFDYGYHNGPMCKRCGYSFCMHCKPNGWNEKPCVIDYYQCPKCGTHIIKDDRKTLYCERCGQVMKWNV